LKVSWRKIQITNFKWKYQRNKKQININHKKDMFLPHILNDILMKLCHSFLRLNYVLYGFFFKFRIQIIIMILGNILSQLFKKKNLKFFWFFLPRRYFLIFKLEISLCVPQKLPPKEKIWFLNSKINLSWLVC